jgi:uncharacterized protein DUF4412
MLASTPLIPGRAQLTLASTLMQHAKLLLSAGCILASAAPPLFAQGFDGVIQFVSYENHPEHPDTMTQMTKGNKVRLEGMGKGGAMIINGTNRIIVIPEQKQYMELPMDLGEKATAGESAKHHGVAVKTGKTENVAGIPCEDWHYKGTDDDGKAQEGDVCVAQGAGFMLNRLAGGVTEHMFDEGGQAFNQAMKNGGGLMKATNNGKVSFVAVKAQATSLPDAMFAPPAGYTKMDVPHMGPRHKP